MSCRTGVAECSFFLGDSPHCTGLPTGRGFRPVRRHPPPRRSFGRVLFFGVPIRYPRFQKKGEQFTTARCLCFSQQPAWRQSAEISQIHHCCAPSPSACQKQTDPARLRRTRSKLETLSMLPTKDIQIDPVPVCQLGTREEGAGRVSVRTIRGGTSCECERTLPWKSGREMRTSLLA